MTARRRTWSALTLIALAAAALLWWETPFGLGLEGDSADYAAMARQLADGRLPRFDAADGRSLPMTQFPPGYPLVLSLGPRLGVDVPAFARVLHAALLAATVVLVGRLSLRHTRSPPLALAASAYVALSPQVHLAFASMMSEALFVPLLLLVAAAVPASPGEAASAAGFRLRLPNPAAKAASPPDFVGAFRWLLVALLLALAGYVRYAGVFTAVAVCATRLCDKPRRGVPRLVESLAMLLLSLGPLVAWTLWLRHLGAEPSRIVRFHPPDAATLRRAISAVGGWVVPISVGGGSVVTGAAGIAVVAAVLWTTARRLKRPRRLARGPGLWAAMLLCYAAGLWASRLLLDEAMPMGTRLWLPAMPLAVLLAADVVRRRGSPLSRRPLPARLARSAGQGRRLSGGRRAIGFCLLALSLAATLRQAAALRRDGVGYASPAWAASPTLAFVRSLPPQVPLASNAADAVTLLLGRPAAPLPMTVFRTSGNDNVHWRDQLRTQGKRLRDAGGVIVFFDAVDRRDFLVRERQVGEVLRLEPAAILGDGRAYRVTGVR